MMMLSNVGTLLAVTTEMSSQRAHRPIVHELDTDPVIERRAANRCERI